MNSLHLYSYISAGIFLALICCLYFYEKKFGVKTGFFKNLMVFSYAAFVTTGLSFSLIFIAVMHVFYKM